MDQGNSAAPDGERKATDVLMLKELPVLAGVVTVVAQPFAQIRQHYEESLPDWLPLLVAAVVSGLLAVYFVRTVRKTSREEALFMIPLLMLMVFSGSIGANNLVESAAGGGQPREAARGVEVREAHLRAQLGNAEKQLEIERERGRLMRKALGLPELDATGNGSVEAPKVSAVERLLGALIADASAQEGAAPAPRPAEKAPVGKKATPATDEEWRRKIAEFDRQQRTLKQQEAQLKHSDDGGRTNRTVRPLWKSW